MSRFGLWRFDATGALLAAQPRIPLAIKALCESLTTSGGMASGLPRDPPGAWSTADALYALAATVPASRVEPDAIRHMATYLLESRCRGGWPLIDGEVACTMATGHALAALRQLELMILGPPWPELSAACEDASRWLVQNQDKQGHWQFGARNPDRASGLMVATYYACMGLAASPRTAERSEAIRLAQRRVREDRLPDGSWAEDLGRSKSSDQGNPSDTARAVQILTTSFPPAPLPDRVADGDVSAGLGYLRHAAKHPRRLAPQLVIVPRSDGSPATLHNNHMCDVVHALSGQRDVPGSARLTRVLAKQLPSNPKFPLVGVPESGVIARFGRPRRRFGRVYVVTGRLATSSCAWACRGVGTVSLLKVAAWPARRVVLRVWVESSASRLW